MAQFAGESQFSVVSKGIFVSVPPTLTLTVSALVPPPLVQGAPLYSVGPWQAIPAPDPVTKSILVAVTRVPEAPMTPFSQGYVTFDTPFAVATSAIGSLPSG